MVSASLPGWTFRSAALMINSVRRLLAHTLGASCSHAGALFDALLGTPVLGDRDLVRPEELAVGFFDCPLSIFHLLEQDVASLAAIIVLSSPRDGRGNDGAKLGKQVFEIFSVDFGWEVVDSDAALLE